MTLLFMGLPPHYTVSTYMRGLVVVAPFQVTGSAAFVVNSSPTLNTFSTLTYNVTAVTKTRRMNGREYLVAPVTMIVPGVLSGSKGPLLYPENEVRKNVTAWNNMPLTLGHPRVSARSPEVLEQYSLGFVFNSRFTGGKLKAEAWFDTEFVTRKAPEVLARIRANLPIELSTGVFTDNYPVRNGIWKGRTYHAVARNYRPDHLAILLAERGACSIADGCGVLMNSRTNSFVVTR